MMAVCKHLNSYDTAVISPIFKFTISAWYPLQVKRINSKGSQSKSFYYLAVGEAECLTKQFTIFFGVVVILFLNVMEVLSVGGGALLNRPCMVCVVPVCIQMLLPYVLFVYVRCYFLI